MNDPIEKARLAEVGFKLTLSQADPSTLAHFQKMLNEVIKKKWAACATQEEKDEFLKYLKPR